MAFEGGDFEVQANVNEKVLLRPQLGQHLRLLCVSLRRHFRAAGAIRSDISSCRLGTCQYMPALVMTQVSHSAGGPRAAAMSKPTPALEDANHKQLLPQWALSGSSKNDDHLNPCRSTLDPPPSRETTHLATSLSSSRRT